MTIKQLLYSSAVVSMSVIMTGCNLDNDENTTYFNVPLCNLVIPSDAGKAVTAQSKVTYNVKYNLGKGTVVVSSDEMSIDGRKVSLTSDAMKYGLKTSTSGYVRDFSGGGTLSDGEVVADLKGFESTLFFYYPTPVPGIVGVSPINTCVSLSYNIGEDYEVKTFGQDMYFGGETVTHYSIEGMGGQSAQTNKAIYRVVFSDDMKSATVVIYNIQFAPQAPVLKAVCLQNLNVSYSATGYTLSGSNVVPQVLEGDGVTDYQRFTFTNFSLSSAGDMLTKCICSYVVAGRFQGSFEGSYVSY